MKIQLPRIRPFDQRTIGKEVIFIFPRPHGIRAVFKTNGTDTTVHTENGEDITGFAPDVEEAMARLYLTMMSEPNPKYTTNGVQTSFPFIVYDVILHDRVTDFKDLGKADNVVAAFEDDWECLGAPVENGIAKATILSHVLYTEYQQGRCSSDIWMQRAHQRRAIIAAGFGIPSHLPSPILSWMVLAPRTVGRIESGVAALEPGEVWTMIYNTFEYSYAGAMIIDVWQGWNVRGNAFTYLNEEDIEI